MSTPRQTRLYRVADLREFQHAIRSLVDHGDLSTLRSSVVIVPSAAAADQLRRTLENHTLGSRQSSDRALVVPNIVTRGGWYEAMHARMPSPPRRLSDLEREVLLSAAAREANTGAHPAPFRLRAGLLVAMLALYDDLRRRNVAIETFERLLTGDLERDAAIDRGAERLLRQTRFMAAAFRGYETRLAASGAVDEHALRAAMLAQEPRRPLSQVVVTIGERSVDPAGLWPADFDLLTQLPLLQRVDIVATRATIAAGLFDRLEKLMPGFEEGELPAGGEHLGPPVVVNGTGAAFTVSRDREDELSAVARVIKRTASSGGAPLDRRAVVFKRPLPYVYLARDVFAGAGIPYQTFDALPLAAEPYAAALDQVFEFVTAEYTREPVVALLGSPHFLFEVDGAAIGRLDVSALNRAFSDGGYGGELDHLRAFASRAPGRSARAARAAVAAAEALLPLVNVERPSVQLAALTAFLAAHDRIPELADPLRERHLRARRTILAAIDSLARAHAEMDDTPVSLIEIAAMIRRWIEGQTFAPRSGTGGVQLLDAQAARYGEFDEMFLVGLIEGEWPQRSSKSIFYPHSLLSQLDWPDSRGALAGERAAFRDLLALPRREVHLSTFELENDAIVSPSVFLEDVERLGLRQLDRPLPPVGRMFAYEGLNSEPVAPESAVGPASNWLGLRTTRSDAGAQRFHGAVSGYRPEFYTVSSLERYLECPFRYFAERVLRLEEDPDDEASMTPQELGIFVHEVFEVFFAEWGRLGRTSIAPETLDDARAVFREVVEPLLARLPSDEAAVQRTRLLGSAADEGLAEAVFQIEAAWRTPVKERLLEQKLEGEFDIQADGQTRRVKLKGKADRIDLLADNTFRLIDYKLTRAPDRKLSLQLPIYTLCTTQHLRRTRDQDWEVSQAGYIAFGRDRRFTSMIGRSKDAETTLNDAQKRLLDTIDAIERGEFPPRPADTHLCLRCAHSAVCRKDYQGDV